MKLNKKGFSLVEILVAILILGILSGLAVVSVSSMLQTAKEDYYDTIEKTIILLLKIIMEIIGALCLEMLVKKEELP